MPDLLVYRKTAEPLVSLKDTQAASQALTQKVLLDEFVERFFHGEDGTLIAAFHPFENAADFETRLEDHLRKLIQSQLQKSRHRPRRSRGGRAGRPGPRAVPSAGCKSSSSSTTPFSSAARGRSARSWNA